MLMTTATINGALRIVSDSHWATDVVAGALLGAGAGYGLAYGLHYGLPAVANEQVVLLPASIEGKPGVTLNASF